MLTRCPACNTRFRVYLEHLYAASGQVRCGRCSHIFDARHQAVTLEPPALSAPSTTFARFNPTPKKPKIMLWNLGSLLLFITLFMQYLWWERYWLIKKPHIDVLITTMCQHLPCNMPEFRDLPRIEILERSLETSKPGIAAFKLSMINRAAQAQLYPILELKLVDADTNIISARRFIPQQYHPNTANEPLLMLPNEPVQVALEIVNLEDKAIGFQIEFW